MTGRGLEGASVCITGEGGTVIIKVYVKERSQYIFALDVFIKAKITKADTINRIIN